MNSIVDSYRSHSRDHRRKKYRKPKKIRELFRRRYQEIRFRLFLPTACDFSGPPRDCRVSEWSPWSSCSKSCGIGEMQRRREVIKHARRGGRLCPPLLETKWCGSARSCNRGFYQWYDSYQIVLVPFHRVANFHVLYEGEGDSKFDSVTPCILC